MRIISWNVNGLRAIVRKGNWDEVLKLSPDILCLQETKARPEQLEETVRSASGYVPYFSSPTVKKGYSGVAVYSKLKPEKVTLGIDVAGNDDEGRVIVAHYNMPAGRFVLINCYFPNGGGGPERLAYKLKFYDEFLAYIEELRSKGHSIIFCGDVNTAHHPIDLARPRENEEHTGFLPEERAWLDEVVSAGYVDVFRHFYPNKKDSYTYWDMKSFARERNVGWRIDYFFVTPDLVKKIKSITHRTDMMGSDHCPLILEIDL